MLTLTFEEISSKIGFDDNAKSNIRVEDIGKDISLITIEIVMRDQIPETIHNPEFDIIVHLHPSDGTHWDLVIR